VCGVVSFKIPHGVKSVDIFPQCRHMTLMDFVVSPPGCGRSVTDI
jgi:hypothetical protein